MTTTDIVYDVLSLWDPHPVPVRHLVAVAEMFGFTDNATRVGIRRLVLRDRVTSAKAGARAGYRLTERHQNLNTHARRACARTQQGGWDGSWLQVMLSVPEVARKSRSKLQESLKVWHFASPYRGVWMRPANVDASADELLATLRGALKDGELDVMRCSFVERARERALVEELWETSLKAVAYRDLIGQLDAMTDSDDLPASDALVETWMLGRDAVRLLFFDPMLPRELLPPEWPGDALREAYGRFRRYAMGLWIDFARATEGYLGLEADQFERVPKDVAWGLRTGLVGGDTWDVRPWS